MGFSQTYLAVITMVLAQILPHIGVTLGNDELTAFVSTAVTLIGALWAFIRRYKSGGITPLGVRTV